MKLKTMVAALALALISSTGTSKAQEWPKGPVTFLAPWAAGGGSDKISRLITGALGKKFGQPFLVEFKPGASGSVGTSEFLHRPKDGSVILITTGAPVVNAEWMIPNLSYNTRDVVPITQIADAPVVIVANASFPPNNLTELVAYAKEKPGAVNSAFSGIGGISHLASALTQIKTDAKFNLVAYKGAGDQVADLMSGVVDIGFGNAAGYISGLEAGRLKLIAVLGENRLEQFPDITSSAEEGFPGLQLSVWYMLFGPKGISQDIVEKLSAAANEALQDPDLKAQFAQLGYITTPDSSPEKANALVEADRQSFEEVFKTGVMAIEN